MRSYKDVQREAEVRYEIAKQGRFLHVAVSYIYMGAELIPTNHGEYLNPEKKLFCTLK